MMLRNGILHGKGLSANALKTKTTRDPLFRLIMSTKNSLMQESVKRIYANFDTLNPNLLSFFYGEQCEIPMTFQSWFAVTQLHLWMVQSRFRIDDAQTLDRALLDHFTTDIELKLHWCKVDHVKIFDRYFYQLLSQHYGSSLAYDEGYETSDAILASALWRNIYSMHDVKPKNLANLVLYTRYQMNRVMNTPLTQLESLKLELPKEINLK